MRVLLDTCVVVDFLQRREPFCDDAYAIFLAASSSQAPYPSPSAEAEVSLAPLLLLSLANPLRWASLA